MAHWILKFSALPIVLLCGLISGTLLLQPLRAGGDTQTVVHVNVYRLPHIGRAIPVYHAGIVIGGKEYFFDDRNQVTVIQPRDMDWELVRTIQRVSPMSREEVDSVLDDVIRSWTGSRYDLSAHNCIDFANDVLTRLLAPMIDSEYRLNSGLRKLDYLPGVTLVLEGAKRSPQIENALIKEQGKFSRLPTDIQREASKAWRQVRKTLWE
ncbi:hypothetical protein SH501x_003220 [Pirellulaceae bacterium SH501]